MRTVNSEPSDGYGCKMKPKRKLRSGFTTGTAAAASAKAATMLLMEGKAPDSIQVTLPGGDKLNIPVCRCRLVGGRAECTVIKDAGDDPDVTNRAIIGARVWKANHAKGSGKVTIQRGEGVGVVTKPGLEVNVGEPAINPIPRKMIREAVQEALRSFRGEEEKDLLVEVFVPNGGELAKKTMNQRLGIVGGISILGTTGVVRPLSHDAYRATITSALSVAKAAGIDEIILTTGRRSERFAQALWHESAEEAFVQIGDYFKFSIKTSARQGFEKIVLAVFFGKAVKMAQGFPYTHAARARMSMEKLADWAFEATSKGRLAGQIRDSNTARQVLGLVRHNYPVVVDVVGERMLGTARHFAGPDSRVNAVIFDYDGQVLFSSMKIQ